TGYTKSYSGAVEAVASTGGQIMPPVMGVAAFIMANTTGIPYSKIIAIALLPALLYFIYLSISLQIKAVKQDFSLPKKEEKGTVIHSLKKDGYLLFSLVVLIASLAKGVPVALSALY